MVSSVTSNGETRKLPISPSSSPSQVPVKVNLIHLAIWSSTLCSEHSTLRLGDQRKPWVPGQEGLD